MLPTLHRSAFFGQPTCSRCTSWESVTPLLVTCVSLSVLYCVCTAQVADLEQSRDRVSALNSDIQR